MFTLIAVVSLIFIGLFWSYEPLQHTSITGDNEPTTVQTNEGLNTNLPDLDSGGDHSQMIKYVLTRWDVFFTQLHIVLHNWLIQTILILGIVCIEGLVLVDSRPRSLGELLFTAAGVAIGLFFVLVVAFFLVAFAIAFLFKHRGVVGEHVLEITERGLLERTEFNEALHKWAAIRRLRTSRRFLYIYVSDLNFHAVPKRCFPSQRIADFEASLRRYATEVGR